MKKKANKKTYYPTDDDMMHMRYCHSIDLAFVMSPIPKSSSSFWIEKYKISDYKKSSFMRVDVNEKDTPRNRCVFNEYDALEKIFEFYKTIYVKNNSKKTD